MSVTVTFSARILAQSATQHCSEPLSRPAERAANVRLAPKCRLPHGGRNQQTVIANPDCERGRTTTRLTSLRLFDAPAQECRELEHRGVGEHLETEAVEIGFVSDIETPLGPHGTRRSGLRSVSKTGMRATTNSDFRSCRSGSRAVETPAAPFTTTLPARLQRECYCSPAVTGEVTVSYL